jgi:hypothetical protein
MSHSTISKTGPMVSTPAGKSLPARRARLFQLFLRVPVAILGDAA